MDNRDVWDAQGEIICKKDKIREAERVGNDEDVVKVCREGQIEQYYLMEHWGLCRAVTVVKRLLRHGRIEDFRWLLKATIQCHKEGALVELLRQECANFSTLCEYEVAAKVVREYAFVYFEDCRIGTDGWQELSLDWIPIMCPGSRYQIPKVVAAVWPAPDSAAKFLKRLDCTPEEVASSLQHHEKGAAYVIELLCQLKPHSNGAEVQEDDDDLYWQLYKEEAECRHQEITAECIKAFRDAKLQDERIVQCLARIENEELRRELITQLRPEQLYTE